MRLRDTWLDAFDCAVIVSNDFDLAKALRLVNTRHHKQIGLVLPGAPKRTTSRQRRQYADFIKPIRTGAGLAVVDSPPLAGLA